MYDSKYDWLVEKILENEKIVQLLLRGEKSNYFDPSDENHGIQPDIVEANKLSKILVFNLEPSLDLLIYSQIFVEARVRLLTRTKKTEDLT